MKVLWLWGWMVGSATASAETLHTGVPVAGVAGLGAADFQTAALGWTAPLTDGGYARVFVGQSLDAAERWYASQLQALTLEPTVLVGLADQAHGDGEALVLFRDGNVGVMVRAPAGARQVAEAIRSAIVDDPQAWPAPPRLVQDAAGTWRVSAPGAVHVSFTGGARATRGRPLVFSTPPKTLTAWDAFGRASEAFQPAENP